MKGQEKQRHPYFHLDLCRYVWMLCAIFKTTFICYSSRKSRFSQEYDTPSKMYQHESSCTRNLLYFKTAKKLFILFFESHGKGLMPF